MQSQQPDNQKNLLLAIILSVCVLMAWHFLYAGPKMKEEQARRQAELKKQEQVGLPSGTVPSGVGAEKSVAGSKAPSPATTISKDGAPPAPSRDGSAPVVPGQIVTAGAAREQALKNSPRVPIETQALSGSIALKGGRIDDLKLIRYRETLSENSPFVTLFSPADAPAPYFAEFGWGAGPETTTELPGRDTLWKNAGGNTLKPGQPVILSWTNPSGVEFRRTISIDADYMFKIEQRVMNKSSQRLSLYPYGRIYRYGTPKIEGFFIAHEGLIGFLGKQGYQEITYSDIQKDKADKTYSTVSGGWLGFTDKYWAATLIPSQSMTYNANLKSPTKKSATTKESFQADFISSHPLSLAPGESGVVTSQMFAGAKRVGLVESYGEQSKIERFDLLIDWGWFHFITRPMFYLLNWLYNLIGNFGVAILAVTVLVKLLFFPLANKSYESMAKMKKLQPEMEKIRDRFKEDKARQQQAMMELYQKEKVNPLAGCLPILVQIPVFFALYKVLFVTIDMRHAPFFGWIQDLSAPDPSSLFNLFGLMPWPSPEAMLLGHTIGAWPLLMGITMWFQMQLNPQQPDPVQQQIFNWMPVIFTVLLAGFAAGLVIYWFWNNVLSIAQQWVIMKRQGVDVPLIENLKKTIDPVRKLVSRKS
ncbi:MAG: Membrane protein insertase YidC [Pseudomonadota bacterium]|jgi:YidC/Oxa1 family membrane protein insertase